MKRMEKILPSRPKKTKGNGSFEVDEKARISNDFRHRHEAYELKTAYFLTMARI